MNTILVRTSCCVALAFLCLICKGQPAPNFSATPLSGCSPLHVNFTDLSTGNPTQWKWDLGNGTISYLKNPSATYFTAGSYTIKLVVENAQGKDSITRTAYINVHGLPEVNFTVSAVNGCAPASIQFNDNTSTTNGANVQWEWDFGDGNISSAQNPSHTYTSPGLFNISLRVTNVHGCTRTVTRQQLINITQPVNSMFSWNIPAGCNVSNTVTFQNQSTGSGILSYSWNFGDGTTSTETNPVHSFPANGNFNVQLTTISSAGCTSVYQIPGGIQIGSTLAVIGSPDSVCVNSIINFSNNSIPSALSSSWTFGDGTMSTANNPSKSFSIPGNYVVQLISDFGGCFDTTQKTINVSAAPVAGFTPSANTSCNAPFTVTFSNTSTGAQNYQWQFGDGNTSSDPNPVHIYTVPGNYNVTLIAFSASGCSDTFSINDAVKITGPEADFSVTPFEGCAPLPVQFNAHVTSVSPITSYHWDFGDGNISTLQNPIHTYPQGIFDIKLIVVTAEGCTDTMVRPQAVRAGIKPVVAFSANPVRSCAYSPVEFTDLTTGNPDRWLWDFGDGGTSTLQHPQHTYGDTGYFTIRLIAWNNGCSDTFEIENYIYIDPPIARFSVDMHCEEPFKRIFTDESIGAHTYNWNFGDGNSSTQQSPVHIYAAAGTYEVVLTVSNSQTGCTFQEIQQVWIIDESATFTATDTVICRNETVSFTGLAAPGNLSSYNWDFGDGTTGFGHSVDHIYSNSGTYSVRLVIIDQHGCSDTLTKYNHIEVNGPTAGFGVNSQDHCMDANVLFIDSSFSDGTHDIISYQWDFGDGTSLSQVTGPYNHTYNSPGSYSVSLTVTDNSGCSDHVSHPGVVSISQPVASFNSDTLVCLGNIVTFNNTSQGDTPGYLWSFGDGTVSSEISPQHTYATTGDYTIQLIVFEASGCADTLSIPNHITVKDPVADFAASDTFGTCPPLVVNFQNSSTGYDSYHWDFGDGTSSNALNPTHFYSLPGTFIAKLTISSAGGCIRTKEQTIIVKGPSGSFSYNELTGCMPHSVNFTATTQNNVSFIWDFNDGNTLATNDSSVAHFFNSPGSYVPKMILKDAGGCTVAVQGTDTIRVEGINATAGFNQQLYCGNGLVQFNAAVNSTSPVSFSTWNFGDGNTSNQQQPSHFYTSPGQYQVSLMVTNSAGCSDTVEINIPVTVHVKPEVTITNPEPGCAPLTTSLHSDVLENSGIISYEWATSNGYSATGASLNNYTFSDPGNYSVRLIVSDSIGCTDTSTSIITVHALPDIDAGTDRTLCLGSPVTLNATGALNYSWGASTTLSCTDCSSPMANPAQNTTYYITGTNAEGCSATDSVMVSVISPFNITASAGDSICAGGNIRLTASGAELFQWFPATGLNTSTGNSVIASPQATTTYNVVGKDIHGCFKDTIRIPITVFPIPHVEAGEDVTINAGQSVDLVPQLSPDVTEVIWTPTGSIFRSTYPAVTVKPSETTTYHVEIENAGGCRASDNITVHVICNDANIFIPNTFSPNGDGNNDMFYPRGSGLFVIRSFRIYNRWGELVFEKNNMEPNNYAGGWNGTYKGKVLPPDVFVFVAEIMCENKTILPVKGNVALIR